MYCCSAISWHFHWLISFVCLVLTSAGFPSIYCSSAIPLADLFLLVYFSINASWISFYSSWVYDSIAWPLPFLFIRLSSICICYPPIIFHWLISLFCLLSNFRWIFSALQFQWLSPTCLLSFATFCLFSDEGNTTNEHRYPTFFWCFFLSNFMRFGPCTYLLINKAATKQRQTCMVSLFLDRFNGQEMLLALNCDGRSTKEKIMDAISIITYTK